MGLRYRDLVLDVQHMAPAPPGPCGCTATANAPACPKGSNPNPKQAPNCPKASGAQPPKKYEALEELRHQLQTALTMPG